MAEKKSANKEKFARTKPISEFKIKTVKALVEKMSKKKTFLIASTKGLPSSQFQEIKKKLRGKSEVCVAKKNLVLKALDTVEKGALKNMKEQITADIALFFSDLDAFELSGLLADNQSPTKARAGDIAPEDIKVEAGPTDLLPGPAISELSGAGLKVGVEEGKLAIKVGTIVAKKGEPIKENVAGVLAKLNITPMKVGFEPIAAYDSVSEKVYVGIKIDKKKALEELRECIGKAFGFAVNVKYIAKETVSYFLAKANAEEAALAKFIK
jgi:large subunit ribosomal protein L10